MQVPAAQKVPTAFDSVRYLRIGSSKVNLAKYPDREANLFQILNVGLPIIHQIRSSTRYINWSDMKAVMADLKKVYQAINEDEAMNGLMEFKEKWSKKHPSCVRSWEENWDILSTFYAYPAEVRRIIYTTNIIEGLNRQFRKITKNKPSFTNDDSLRKMLYLASQNITGHWTVVCRNWDMVSNQLRIMFED